MGSAGKVYLVGAGPGDPALLTLRGTQCLHEAQVVIYDPAIDRSLLDHHCPQAELIDAGKPSALPAHHQSKIGAVMAEQARLGKVVARLYWGDPFFFNQGGKEGKELAQAGIPFEVVPGIPPTMAIPAYAGIPMTCGALASSVAFIPLHEKWDKVMDGVTRKELSTGVATLVLATEVGGLPQMVEQLISGGRPAGTPTALVRWGTTAPQETVVATLATLVAKTRHLQPSSKAIVVVGEVVKLRGHLNWFETRPLYGRRIVITRSHEHAPALAALLQGLGAAALIFPTIRILPAPLTEDMAEVLQHLPRYRWVIFTSANGVRYFFQGLRQLRLDIRLLHGVQICAIGPKTAQALEQIGLWVDFLPSEFRAEAIVEGLGGLDLTGQPVLIPRAQEARAVLPETLRKMGAVVDILALYRTVPPDLPRGQLEALWGGGPIDLVMFTSPSTVTNFIRMVGEDHYRPLLEGVKIACIGPVTADKVRSCHLTVDVMPQQYTAEALVEAIVSFFSKG